MKLKSKTHGFLDYMVAVLLIVSPWLFGFNQQGIEGWLPITLGIVTLLYSLLTNYELGAGRIIPFRVHLGIDVLSGIFLAMSPWLFNFHDRVYLPHLVIGILEIVVATFTESRAAIETASDHPGKYGTRDHNTVSHSH